MNTADLKATSVTAGSRLHFGLTRIRPGQAGCLNGVGVMIEYPRTELRIRPAAHFQTRGSNRLRTFADSWSCQTRMPLPACEMELVENPPAHSGFGSGTQLAQAVACGLAFFAGCGAAPCAEQARKAASAHDRGHRSMIGSYGFATGGLIVDGTDENGQSVLVRQIELPSAWRVVVVVPSQAHKKFGLQEQSAFANIQVDQRNRSRRLEHLIEKQLAPAAEAGDFDQFSDTVFEYGKLSGEYYTSVQGGIYNGPVITAVVDALLQLKARGIGQSSWGPAVFAWCENQPVADDLISRLPNYFGDSVELFSTSVRNQPATVRHATESIKTPSN